MIAVDFLLGFSLPSPFKAVGPFILCLVGLSHSLCATDPPNIVYILADDLGYGDLGCYNTDSKIPTSRLDQFARQGMRFTDAHAPSSVCTPTRYALLTGRYAWRTRLQRNVLGPWDKPLIAADRLTVGKLLQQHGYETACIGKWHLGQSYATTDGKPAVGGSQECAEQCGLHEAHWRWSHCTRI
jgi:arylsulfatase A